MSLASAPSRICLLSTFLVAGLPLAAPLGCGPGEAPGPRVEVKDSAGIALVLNTGEAGPDGGGWSLTPEPLLSIGTFQGDSLHQLYQVEGAARLADGGVAVANAGSGEIRIYGPDGRFVAAHGRKGEGPGEFQQLALAGKLGGDTLVVVDNQLLRVSLFQAREGFLTSARISEELGGGVYPRGMFQNRTIVLGGGFYWSSDSGDQLANGYTRRDTSYRSCSLGGELATDFGAFPGSEFFMQVRNEGGSVSMAARLIPFGKYAMQAVGPRHLYLASGDAWEIRALSSSGRLERVIRWNRAPTPVSPADLEAYVEARVAEASDPSEAQGIRQSLEGLPLPDLMPAFASLEADALGYLWVERYRRPGDDTPVYDILDPEGGVVGWVALPESMQVLEIGPDYLLGLHRDELEVEYLRVYGLARPDLPPA